MATNLTFKEREKNRLKTDQLLNAVEAALTIAGNVDPLSGGSSGRQWKVPRHGIGGYEEQPYDDFGNYRGPAIMNPKTQLLEWAGSENNNNNNLARRKIKKKYGPLGGTTEPFDKEGNDNYPPIRNPNPGQPFDWAGNSGLTIAGKSFDVNTPWLPGGQSTEGIPNITNPKLKKKLQQNKGIKGSDPTLFPLASANDLQIAGVYPIGTPIDKDDWDNGLRTLMHNRSDMTDEQFIEHLKILTEQYPGPA